MNAPPHPFDVLTDFLEREHANTAASVTEPGLEKTLRFVGYVLDLGYDNARIITCDPLKNTVGGIPRSSFLILAPRKPNGIPPHFSVLRVRDIAPTPLSEQVQQTYFELHKKSMPELDIWTTNELQWGALNCDMLGMMYPDPDQPLKVAFAGDQTNIRSPHHYLVYSPPDEVLDLIVNGLVPTEPRHSWTLGDLRPTETQFHHLLNGSEKTAPIPVRLASADFIATRTAMFGKTRLGKSNVVKLIAEGVITNPPPGTTVGQVIFDVNGEYANDNAQDGTGDEGGSLFKAHQDECVVYALKKRGNTPSHELRLNFYENAPDGMTALRGFLETSGRGSMYITNFATTEVPEPSEVANHQPYNERTRLIRKVLAYWAVLHKAGYPANESRLGDLRMTVGKGKFNPGFDRDLRAEAYSGKTPPERIATLDELLRELELFTKFAKSKDWDLATDSGKPLFDAGDQALLKFLVPDAGKGPQMLGEYAEYHSPDASAVTKEIILHIRAGKTVILDLGSATDTMRQYFSDIISNELFVHQEWAFTHEKLKNHYVQLYFEEAHNLFPPGGSQDMKGIYARFAKEGAKFHIGMVYSTQSPSTINGELLTQTENFFVGHLSSEYEVKALSRLQTAFSGVEQDILRTKQPGYMRMLTRSHRFVIPVQARMFQGRK
ncbi:helicase HerA domain-containing protein [Glycomyces harbinensis]|uniref:Helicase HerA central domain-containing protein n=1 Tax=Glycomyces harbinensis TaxID=58114 RepID=A0A1G6ZWQ1_9ACTN|nr:DUF87 domain-containing protein [Glycomyces harbinensis]SDE07108.1 protein of unknown function DUF87 [Glycomyces harbinensis]